MNANENFRSIQNTVVSQTTVNPVLQDNLVVSDYGLFSRDESVTVNSQVLPIFSHPVVPRPQGYFAPAAPAPAGTLLSLEQVLRAKENASLMGLLVNTADADPAVTVDGYLTLPVFDDAAGAYELLATLNLLSTGKQCLLKFSRFGYQPNPSGVNVYLNNKSGTQSNVQFAENNDNKGPEGLLFGPVSTGPFTLVVATNVTLPNSTDYRIEFRSVVFSINCDGEPAEPGQSEPEPEI